MFIFVLVIENRWTFSSLIEYASSIISISVISYQIGLPAMLAYSYVWFILDAAHIINGALYESIYKHVNNAVAHNTREGNFKAGQYMRFGLILNAVLSIPIGFILILMMETFIGLFGYDEEVTGIARNYTILAVTSNLISYSSSLICCCCLTREKSRQFCGHKRVSFKGSTWEKCG